MNLAACTEKRANLPDLLPSSCTFRDTHGVRELSSNATLLRGAAYMQCKWTLGWNCHLLQTPLRHDYVQNSRGVPPTACAASWILRVAFAVAACVPVVDVAEASEGEAATNASACALAAGTT